MSNSPVADVILYDYVTEQAQMGMEIAHDKGVKSDLKRDRFDEDAYGIREGFRYKDKTGPTASLSQR